MRKIIFILMLVMGFVVNTIDVKSQSLGCGPTPFPCIADFACANGKCTAEYNICDTAASKVCMECVDSCPDPVPPCVAACKSAYVLTVLGCQTEATTLQSTITASGVYQSFVGCNEMNDCLLQVAISKLQSYDRLTCGGITESTYAKIFGDHGS